MASFPPPTPAMLQMIEEKRQQALKLRSAKQGAVAKNAFGTNQQLAQPVQKRKSDEFDPAPRGNSPSKIIVTGNASNGSKQLQLSGYFKPAPNNLPKSLSTTGAPKSSSFQKPSSSVIQKSSGKSTVPSKENQKPNNNVQSFGGGGGGTNAFTQLKNPSPPTQPALLRPQPQPETSSAVSNVTITISAHLKGPDRFVITLSKFSKWNNSIIKVFQPVASRQWEPNESWSFALKDYQHICNQLRNLNGVSIKFANYIPEVIIRALLKANAKSRDIIDLTERLNATFVQKLFPFQQEGIRFAIRHDGRCLIADDMGLGKTIQAISIAKWYREDWPLIIICPASLRYQWKESLLRWVEGLTEEDIQLVQTTKESFSDKVSITIASYEMITRMDGQLNFGNNQRFNMFIMDESHYIKTDTAKRTQVVVKLAATCKRVILLSGTPALSKPMELFPQINLLNPSLFSSKHEFGLRYCDAKSQILKNRTVWFYKGASNLSELDIILTNTIMIQRMKKDVLQQLPSKRREMVCICVDNLNSKELNQLKMFRHETMAAKNRLSIMKWFNASADAKVVPVSEYIKEYLETHNTKLIVFCHHMTMMDGLQDMLGKLKVNHVRIDGNASPKARNDACYVFQNNPQFSLALLSITACSTGLNLTAATTVIFAEIFWNPGILIQAEDRVHRIGQTKDVRIIYLVARNTIDEFMWPLIQRKLDVLKKAGLSKDTFENTHNPLNVEPDQRLMDEFMENLSQTN